MQNYVHTKSEQTSEKGDLEGPGYHGNYTLVRKKIVGVKQAVAQFTARAGASPKFSVARPLWKEAGLFSVSPQRSWANLGTPETGGLTGGSTISPRWPRAGGVSQCFSCSFTEGFSSFLFSPR